MRQFWELWLGHFLGLAMLGTLILTGYFGYQSAVSTTSDRMFIYFIAAVLSFLLVMVLGALTAWKYNTRAQRRYIRHEAKIISVDLPPAGRLDLPDGLPTTGPVRPLVHDAPVVNQKGSRK